MSLYPPVRRLLAGLLLLIAFSSAQAQRALPFIEPDYFGPDLQFFAPADLSEFGNGPAPKTGFYIEYSRMYLWTSRPDNVPDDGFGIPGAVPFAARSGVITPQSPSPGNFGPGLDDGWGNRYDFGYMTNDQHGWAFTFMDLNGPREMLVVEQESLARFIGGAAATTLVPDIIGIEQSLNAGSLRSFELSKVWRLDTLHSGAVFEPMLGMRYQEFRDFYRHMEYDRYAAIPPGEMFPDLLLPAAIGPNEVIATRNGEVFNQMVGGQVGFRLLQQTGHWTLSAEVKAMLSGNFQHSTVRDTVQINNYDGAGGVLQNIFNGTTADAQNSRTTLVWGGDIRTQANYQLTRDIALNFGVQYLHYARGIGRSAHNYTPLAPQQPQNQTVLYNQNNDVVMAGFTFGFVVNR